MFCIKCGTKLPDNARFCPKCGASAYEWEINQTQKQDNQQRTDTQRRTDTQHRTDSQQRTDTQWRTDTQQTNQRSQSTESTPVKTRPKVPIIVSAAVIVILIICSALIAAHKSKAGDTPNIEKPSASSTSESDLQSYENKDVCFSLYYPKDFEMSEPNMNNVLLGVGDECRVAVEYAYMTTSNCFIYSAEDFARQIEADPTVFSGYLGADGVEFRSEGQEAINGQESYVYGWTLSQNGKDYTGGFYIFDSKGEFGCYTFMWMVENGTDNTADYHKQITHQILPSFKITGKHQAEGYTLYEQELKGVRIRFALQDEFMRGEIEANDLTEMLDIYPVPLAERKTGARIYITPCMYSIVSADPELDTAADEFRTSTGFFFTSDSFKEAEFISSPTAFHLGRYPLAEVDVRYRYVGTGDNYYKTDYRMLLARKLGYWQVNLSASDENLEQTANVLVDLLMSIRFEDETLDIGDNVFGSLGDFQVTVSQSGSSPSSPSGSADMNDVIDRILSLIESTGGFVQPDQYYQPLASFTDIDGNGVHELLAVYKISDSSGFHVVYDVYTVNADGSFNTLISQKKLYDEVGGNSGVIGLVIDMAKKPYLMIEQHNPQGDRFNDYITFTPWNSDQSKFEYGDVYLEAHGVYGEEENGEYIIGATVTDMYDYEARQTEFMSLWTDLDINRGPGNGGNNMSFSQIRSMDMNTYTFESVN